MKRAPNDFFDTKNILQVVSQFCSGSDVSYCGLFRWLVSLKGVSSWCALHFSYCHRRVGGSLRVLIPGSLHQVISLFVQLRKLKSESGKYFFPFSESLKLRELILGPRCDIWIETIGEVAGREVCISKAKLSESKFRVVWDLSGSFRLAPGESPAIRK